MTELKEDVIDYEEIVNQIYRQEMNRTHEFNLMLVGLSGIGKSSLVRSLFQGLIKPKEVDGGPRLNEYREIIEENGVRLRLGCIETSNFESHDKKLYTECIEDRLKKFFVTQLRNPNSNIEDTRVHCCLYLIPAHAKMRLRDEDIECMKALQEIVNIIPILSKSDILNPSQRAKFKEIISSDLKRHGIKYFAFNYDEKEDEDRAKIVKQEAERFPFAVVSADEPTIENNRTRWIRKTGTGTVDIFDKEFDFDALSRLLIRHCMINLIDSTHVKHYARYKSQLYKKFREEGPEVLRAIGLEEHEVFRIERWSKGDRRPLNELRKEMEEDLRLLRARLEKLRANNSTQAQSPSKLHKPEITRPKPPILHEKPEYLKTRVSEFYRGN